MTKTRLLLSILILQSMGVLCLYSTESTMSTDEFMEKVLEDYADRKYEEMAKNNTEKVQLKWELPVFDVDAVVSQRRTLPWTDIAAEDSICWYCGELADCECAMCGKASYCDGDCQRIHWHQHKHACRLLRPKDRMDGPMSPRANSTAIAYAYPLDDPHAKKVMERMNPWCLEWVPEDPNALTYIAPAEGQVDLNYLQDSRAMYLQRQRRTAILSGRNSDVLEGGYHSSRMSRKADRRGAAHGSKSPHKQTADRYSNLVAAGGRTGHRFPHLNFRRPTS